MRAERFAVGVADERGAIVDFGGTGAGSLKVLCLGEEGEPAAKGHAVAVVIQAEKVGGAVLKGVGGNERGSEPERGRRGIGELHAHADLRGKDAGTNAGGGIGDVFHCGGVGRIDGDARPPSGVEGEGSGVVAIGEKAHGFERDAGWRRGLVPRPEKSYREDGAHQHSGA